MSEKDKPISCNHWPGQRQCLICGMNKDRLREMSTIAIGMEVNPCPQYLENCRRFYEMGFMAALGIAGQYCCKTEHRASGLGGITQGQYSNANELLMWLQGFVEELSTKDGRKQDTL